MALAAATWLAATAGCQPPSSSRIGDITLPVSAGSDERPAPPLGTASAIPAPSPAAADPAEEPAASARAPVGGAPAGSCVEVSIGLDMRALPTTAAARPEARDMFVASQIDEFRKLTPGPPPQVFIFPGEGSFRVVFTEPDRTRALARCAKATAAYLAKAPRLPIIRQAAATVVAPCAVCP